MSAELEPKPEQGPVSGQGPAPGLGLGPGPGMAMGPEPEPEPEPEPAPSEPDRDTAIDAEAAAQYMCAQWGDLGSECAEMEFVDEIRARQIEHMVGTGRLPVAIASARGFHTPRAPSPRSGRSRSGGRQSGRFLAQRDVAPAAMTEIAPHVPLMPRPPPPRPPASGAHHTTRHRGGRPLARTNAVC